MKACPLCKTTPKNVIWDGVSISFGRKQVNNHLEPPTVVAADSAIPLGDKNEQKLLKGALARRNAFFDLHKWLETENEPLGNLFRRTLGFSALRDDLSWKPRIQHLRLFQLEYKFSAEESTVQAVNRSALKLLQVFVAHPTYPNARALVQIPALYKVLEIEYNQREQVFHSDIIGVAQWMCGRADDVLTRVLALESVPLRLLPKPTILDKPTETEIRDWEKVSV
ncbi:hypothetical protein GYMLUDRAFT_63318 [Collybiopsis luxurians FD-317 M1]|uniref:Uncharacterized protein n=1 Tax=Collybiopsis luxurians FD-317 M1 TaxID=944289 RepID=A0A0D0BHA2_9AGAR|nr:hypothetical protein GYMLUDRAFT_63318 [Collybiopsis luxurians FD-317 M1]